ncbi:MAG: hypothetical protein QOE70_4059 [Chthoniobacter sp.]|jgi:hypothetical protein|nr:hypothetical protein [Chthoniobacter sp.]
MPESLMEHADAKAKAQGRSRSNYFQQLVRGDTGKIGNN